ncbi:thioesterase II family protein [Paenibacillus donghaensis]|uniref:Thioesterase domain-containing protein n=1 Tax=Paenibacillus donghaensis TaxID=414771 RepID=A0A2Z2KET1_9BACL|nr:alpha/beta fold hydrolase [Paenibacillus donghaensis]ASA21613.1 hypothetical protein B9T62_13040 [Paenibacillus donghaensis]
MTIKLFTIPYSGSSAAIYLKWRTLLPKDIEVLPLEFPGRGKRFGSKLCDNMKELIDDLALHIGSQLEGSPYALFGHSLGGLAAYELSVRLMESGQALPVHLFLSGCNPPHLRYGEEQLHKLPDDQFLQEIIKLGGTAQELVNNAELMRIFLPIIKSDYRIYELYAGNDQCVKLPVDCTVMLGIDDPLMPAENGPEWARHISGSMQIHKLPGGHFFLHDQQEDVIATIQDTLVVHK